MPKPGLLREQRLAGSTPSVDDASNSGSLDTQSSEEMNDADTPAVAPSGFEGEIETRRLKPYRDWSPSETAADALARIGAAAVPELMTNLAHPEAQQRLTAALVLGRIGPDASAAVAELVKRLEDVDPQVRRASARALGQIGPEAAAAVPGLIQMLNEQP